jgi:hypothetical protein
MVVKLKTISNFAYYNINTVLRIQSIHLDVLNWSDLNGILSSELQF